MTSATAPRRVSIIGIGLIGGSIGLALRNQGWHVSGTDANPAAEQAALEVGAIDSIGLDPASDITFVATPVSGVAEGVQRALGSTSGAVTDVGSVKGPIAAAIADSRFVGGHPMAGSELLGVAGADPELFEGAVWVLTPVAATDAGHFATVDAAVRSMGADVIALDPGRHDALVAVVSHVPHLTAAALMGVADERADEHAALLRLAAGGFRDMTRIAAGSPNIWPDICSSNQAAIVEVIDRLTGELERLRTMVATDDRQALLDALGRAQRARRNLPGRVVRPSEMAEIRVPVPDRDSVISEVSTLASELGISIADLFIAHSIDGDRGVLVLLVDQAAAETYRSALVARGYRPAVTPLE